MGLGDFLFQGAAPIPAPTGSDTSTAFPLWLQTGIYDALTGAANLAQQPYTPFPGPTVAAPSSATTAAQNLAQNNVGAWAPYVGAAGALNAYGAQGAIGAQQQAGQNAGIWQPYLNQAGALTGSAVPAAGAAQNFANSSAGAWQPALSQAGALTANAAGLAGQGANIATNGLGVGLPYLNNAASLTQSGSQGLTPDAISSVMNPFQDYITGALNRNLMQNILPKVQDRFVGSGQSASPQDAELTAQSIYGTQQAAGQAMAGAYQGALNSALASNQQKLAGGQQYGALGQLASSLNTQGLDNVLSAANAYGNAGAQTGQIGALTSQLTGSQIAQMLAPSQFALQAGQQYGALGQAAQSMSANDINTLLQTIGAGTGVAQQSATLGALNSQLGAVDVGQLAASGQQQDTLAQANINAALNQFSQQQQWPYQNVAYLSDIIRGLPVQAAGSTTQTAGTTYPSAYGPSAFSSFLGTAGLSSALGLKHGGRVRANRRPAFADYRKAA